jgi:hypothetical protein
MGAMPGEGAVLALQVGWVPGGRMRIRGDPATRRDECPRAAGAKGAASRGEGLVDPCQLLLDAIQARVNGLRPGAVLLEEAVEEALVRDAAVCGQFLQRGQAVRIHVDREYHNAFQSSSPWGGGIRGGGVPLGVGVRWGGEVRDAGLATREAVMRGAFPTLTCTDPVGGDGATPVAFCRIPGCRGGLGRRDGPP